MFQFKDAGCRLADGGGFASSSYDTTRDVTPVLYSAYTPLYPAAFGAWAASVGCGLEQNRVFELVLVALLATSSLVLFSGAFASHPRARLAALVAVAATAPVAGVALLDDRPELLGLVLLAAQWILMTGAAPGQRRRAVYLVAAVTFLASPFVGSAAALLAYAFNLDRTPGGARAALSETAKALVWFGGVPALVAAGFLLADGQSLGRFTDHVADVARSDPGAAAAWASAWFSSSLHSVTLMTKWTVVALALAGVTFAARRDFAAAWRPLLVAWVVMASPFFVHPEQNNYFLAGSFITLMLLATWNRIWRHPLAIRPAAVAGLIAVYCSLAAPEIALSVLMRLETRDSAREQGRRVAALGDRLSRLQPDEWFLIPHGAYFFYRPYTSQLFAIEYMFPAFPRERVAGVALCDAGQPADLAVAVPQAVKDLRFTPAAEPAHAQTTIGLFGRRVMRRQWGAICTNLFRQRD